MRQELNLDANHLALVMLDRFCAQCTSAILTLLENNNVRVAIVPANCMNRLQIIDVSINKTVKDPFLKVISKIGTQIKFASNCNNSPTKTPPYLQSQLILV